MFFCEETQKDNAKGRAALKAWDQEIKQNVYTNNPDFQHSVSLYLPSSCHAELEEFGDKIVNELEPLVIENNLARNLPYIESYDGIGYRIDKIVHHPSYEASGNIIYHSRILGRMAKAGGLTEALAFMFLSSHTGEAGHNCPLACSAGIIRVLQKTSDFPQKDFFLKKLIDPSYASNYTGAQFLTEVQGGSDVGKNATIAFQDPQGHWRIKGEKWFCSNADAELILITARFNPEISGTKGLGLFLIPAHLETKERNHYTLRRLKNKIGTQSMASGEIDFHDAYAICIGKPEEGFKMVMENVLHISRLFNTMCVLGMAQRALQIASTYAKHRVAFGQPVIHYPLVKENLARIKAENTAMMASIFATSHLQDEFDTGKISGEENKLLLRLLANLNKYLSAWWSVEHIHHALDVLAGNGAIESFSPIPRLFRDSIVCENWEGTHNVLRMQTLRDIDRYQMDEIFLKYLEPKIAQNGILKQGFSQLKELLAKFKKSSDELRTLQIKAIVDKMGILFCASQLMQEAQNNKSKKHCFDYFVALHFNQSEPDETYLKMIDHIF